MKIYKWAILVMAILIVSGCQNNSGASSNNNQKVPKTQPANNAGDAASELLKVLGNKATLKWQISYNLISQAQGNNFQVPMVQYVDGKNKIRTDLTTQGVEARTYFIDGTITSCTQNSGSWNCYKSEPQKNHVSDAEKDVQINKDKYAITSDGAKTVAGASTNCFKIVEKSSAATINECFSSEGLPLYISYVSSDSTTEMTATKYSTTLASGTFDVPAAASASPAAQGSSGAAGGNSCSTCNYMSGSMKDSCLASCG